MRRRIRPPLRRRRCSPIFARSTGSAAIAKTPRYRSIATGSWASLRPGETPVSSITTRLALWAGAVPFETQTGALGWYDLNANDAAGPHLPLIRADGPYAWDLEIDEDTSNIVNRIRATTRTPDGNTTIEVVGEARSVIIESGETVEVELRALDAIWIEWVGWTAATDVTLGDPSDATVLFFTQETRADDPDLGALTSRIIIQNVGADDITIPEIRVRGIKHSTAFEVDENSEDSIVDR